MKHNTLVFPVIPKYDVFQLKKDYAKNFSLGMTAAVLIHILLIGTYLFVHSFTNGVERKTQKPIDITWDRLPLPNDKPPIVVPSPGTILKNLIPIAVPDDKAPNDKLIPTQPEISGSLVQTGNVQGADVRVIPPNISVETPKEEIPDIHGFTPTEKAPELVSLVTPEYPELARRSGLEGTVYVRLLIGKDGKPMKAIAEKFDAEIFVKPSIDAAMKSVFTPAIQHKAAVMVWITVPFKFRLNN
jgi:protein TonB